MRRGRVSQLAGELEVLRSRIDEVANHGQNGGARRHRKLLSELLSVVNGSGAFELVPESVPRSRSLAERIARRIELDPAIPRAIYDSEFYSSSVDPLLARRQINASEWDFVQRLARTLDVKPSTGQERLDVKPPWMIDVDESHQYIRVWIREQALQDMLLAAVEAFLVPAGQGKPSTEIYGIVFGSFRNFSSPQARRPFSMIDLNVERVCIQHRAQGGPAVVFADERSEVAHLQMAQELFPFWHVLGDFHTHTYRTFRELHQRRGWEYSRTDLLTNIEWCQRMRAIGHRPRVALILALARASRSGYDSHENWRGRPHVVRTAIGACHCLISAYRIRPDGHYSPSGLTLRCPHLAGYSPVD